MTELISTAEAAKRLAVSQTQIRRMVQRGRLEAELEERPQGSRLRIRWDPSTPRGGHQDATRDATTDAPPTHQDALSGAGDATQDATYTTHLLEENTWLRDRLEAAEREREQLRQLLAMEQTNIAALRQLLPEPGHHDAPSVATQDATSTQPRAPWWAFWRHPPSEPSPA